MLDEPANVYYNPEKFGLIVIAELEDSQAHYDYDTIVAWRHTDGTVYWQQDSGCSCPTPFEQFGDLASLNRAAPDLRDLIAAVDAHQHHTYSQADAFMQKVREAQKQGCAKVTA
jgi:hypothetical protein